MRNDIPVYSDFRWEQAMRQLDAGELKSYKVGIVGEARYQEAIVPCTIGEAVLIKHEVGNPADPKTLMVLSSVNRRIGYIARDHWLRDAVHDEDKAIVAKIARMDQGEGGLLGMVLTVATYPGPILTSPYYGPLPRSPINEQGHMSPGDAAPPAVRIWVALKRLFGTPLR